MKLNQRKAELAEEVAKAKLTKAKLKLKEKIATMRMKQSKVIQNQRNLKANFKLTKTKSSKDSILFINHQIFSFKKPTQQEI